MKIHKSSFVYRYAFRVALVAIAISLFSLTAPSPASAECSNQIEYWGCSVRADYFNGTSLSTGTPGWGIYHSPTSVHPRDRYNVRVRDGELQLVGTYNQSTKKIMGAGVADHYNQLYGRWEVRMRVDKGAGFSAAGLLWPLSNNWPTDGEIDLHEVPKSDRQAVWQVIHNGKNNAQQSNKTTLDATQWHNYVVEWTPSSAKYYIDGRLRMSVTNSALIPKNSAMHLALQLDARRAQDGGCDALSTWNQCANSSTPYETIMHVAYIKVWKRP